MSQGQGYNALMLEMQSNLFLAPIRVQILKIKKHKTIELIEQKATQSKSRLDLIKLSYDE